MHLSLGSSLIEKSVFAGLSASEFTGNKSFKRNTNIKYSMSFLLIVFICLFTCSTFVNAQTVRTLAVTGEAKKHLAPDAFSMSFTFEQKGQDLVSVKSDVDGQVEKASQLLTNNDVLAKNIRSMDVNVYPWVETEQRERVTKGFVYRRTVFFTHEDIDAYDSIIKKVAALKPQQIGQLSLINQNIDSIERSLVKDALADARDKAKDMATALDMEIGHVLFMSDGTRPPEDMLTMRSGDMMIAQSRGQTSSLPGENTISTSVQVVFEIHTISSRPR